jgi:hypothetical protein
MPAGELDDADFVAVSAEALGGVLM